MIRRHQFSFIVDVCTLPLIAHDDTVLRPFEMFQHDFIVSLLGGLYSRLTTRKKKQPSALDRK